MKFLPLLILLILPELSNAQCQDSLIKWTHDFASRFQILDSCITVTGKITHINKERDGDIFIRLKPDAEFIHLLNDKNKKEQHNCLVVEIVCAIKIKQKGLKPYHLCDGYQNHIKKPGCGAHVRISGLLVLDKPHGWTEIHPASSIEVIQ